LKAYVLAAIASAYSDPSANNKAAIAAHRMDADNVQPQFLKESAWQVIPAPILKAAGIHSDKKDKGPARYSDQLDAMTGGKRARKK